MACFRFVFGVIRLLFRPAGTEFAVYGRRAAFVLFCKTKDRWCTI